jgi:hypothetical protein
MPFGHQKTQVCAILPGRRQWMTDKRLGMAAAALAWLCASGVAHAQMSPKALVQRLYGEQTVSMSGQDEQRYLANDLSQALKADSHPGEVGAIDFDYRYGAQDVQIAGLNILETIDNDEAQVVAVFKNFNRPHSVNWKLCKRPGGDWRIYDAWSNTGEEWDLRQMLRMPPEHGKC